MRKLVFGLLLALGACSHESKKPDNHLINVQDKAGMHFYKDGRVAYQGDNNLWYWSVYNMTSQPYNTGSSSRTPSSIVITKSFTAGSKPNSTDEEEEVNVEENATVAVVEPEPETEADQTNQQSVDNSQSESTNSGGESDAGSADSGGGGDAGGGGGGGE